MDFNFSADLRALPICLVLLALIPDAADAQVRLTEFLASNESGKKDQNGEYSDWMEIHNAGADPVNLLNWSLTDKIGDKTKWSFPAVTLPAGGYIVVFASEKNRTDPDAELHTNFKLTSSGEYLALVQPDGVVATEYAPAYPQQMPDVSYGLNVSNEGYSSAVRYFLKPTPGTVNGTGISDPGPILSLAAHSPQRPVPGQDLVVSVKVARASAEVASVKLSWIAMYDSASNPLKEVAMQDDGLAGDTAAGDGIFTGIIPGRETVENVTSNTFGEGRLIRWKFTATDTASKISHWPLFSDRVNSAEYMGTVAGDPSNFTTKMPVWYWFAKNTGAAATDAGTRGSVYFKDRYYDNILIRRRGGATSTNSKKFDFNSGDHCYIDEVVGKVEEANLNISGQDSTLARPPMAFEVFRTTGHPACAAFPMLQRMANSPTSPTSGSSTNTTTYFVEQPDERYLARWGLDPEGALYKMNQKSNLDPVFTDSTDGVEKKTRKTENNADIAALSTALKKRTSAALREQRQTFLWDNLDLPNMVNYLAVRAVINDYDDVRKNFYMYRDTNGDHEWKILPWDKDGTLGVTGDGGTWLAHPFFGDFAHLKQNSNQWNLLWEAIFNDPRTQSMYLRRLRTLMDTVLQPVSVPAADRYLEGRADAWGAQFDPVRNVSVIKSFLNSRRTQLFSTYSITTSNAANRLIPLPQEISPPITFGEVDPNPADGDQQKEFIEIKNPTDAAVDITGWTVSGGIDHTFRPGTVIPARDHLYLANSALAFRSRITGPGGGQQLFVQGGWAGSLSARGENLTIKNDTGVVVASLTTPSAPTAAQSALRITKLMYAPANGGNFSAGDYEFVELRNIGLLPLPMGGIYFDKGITWTFPEDVTLAAGARILVVKNAAAFTARYGPGLPVTGEYAGSLDNSGERLRILDRVGEEILDFRYESSWYPATDGQGAALVIADDAAPWSVWGMAEGWRASTSLNGTPGGVDTPPIALPALIQTAPGKFRIQGEPLSRCSVQRSVDLISWSAVATVTLGADGETSYADTAPPAGGKAFYRCARP